MAGKRLVPPRPPADLATIELPTERCPRRWLYRVCDDRFDSCLHFSRRGLYRFDSPTAPWGVCYLGLSIETAIFEVFGDRMRQRRLDWTPLTERVVWKIEVPRDLNLLALKGAGLVRIRATMQSFVSGYTLSQDWARALMSHPSNLDGLMYTGRQSGDSCLALFGDNEAERGRGHQRALHETRLGRLSEWEELFPLLDRANARISGLPARIPSQRWQDT